MHSRVRRSAERPNYTTLDLFAGCGGLTEGFISARDMPGRFIPIGAVELDRHAAATYAVNFGPHVHLGGIEDWIGTGLPAVDVVIGGPPCQGFSRLGLRDPDDNRNKLWCFYAEAVAAARPKYFVLENVVPFLRSAQFRELERATEPGGLLEDWTLEGSPGPVLASEFGAAQKRHRALVVGRRRDLPPVDLAAFSAAPGTVRDAIGWTPRTVARRDLDDRWEAVRISNASIKVPGIYKTSELHITRQFTPVSLKRFRAIPPGGNRHDLPRSLLAPCWMDHATGSHDVMGRLHWDRPSVTIRTEFWKPEKGRYLHPTADRPITHMEAALLQGFPTDFRWCGTKISIGRQIGNAVPVELGRAVARSILAALDDAGVAPGA